MITLVASASPVTSPGAYQVLEEGQAVPEGWVTLQVEAPQKQLRVTALSERRTSFSRAGLSLGASHRELCIAPCTLAFAPGLQTIGVRGRARTPGFVRVDARSGSRHAIAFRTGLLPIRYLGWLSLLGGAAAVLIGGPLVAIDANDRGAFTSDQATMFKASAGVGAAMVAVSVPLFVFSRTRGKVRQLEDR